MGRFSSRDVLVKEGIRPFSWVFGQAAGMYAMDITAPYAPRFCGLWRTHYRGEEERRISGAASVSVERTGERFGSWRAWMTTGTSFIGFHPSADRFLNRKQLFREVRGEFKGSVYVGRVEDGSMVRELEAPAD